MGCKEKLQIARKKFFQKKNMYYQFSDLQENQKEIQGLLEKMKRYRKFIAIYKNSRP